MTKLAKFHKARAVFTARDRAARKIHGMHLPNLHVFRNGETYSRAKTRAARAAIAAYEEMRAAQLECLGITE